jgi:hypothetical protein
VFEKLVGAVRGAFTQLTRKTNKQASKHIERHKNQKTQSHGQQSTKTSAPLVVALPIHSRPDFLIVL